MIAQTIAQRLLDRLAELGIQVQCHGDRLRLTPANALTPELLNQLSQHKRELMALLQGRAVPDDRAAGCEVCRHGDWIDEPPRDGRVRTHCGRCGRFVGFRPDRRNRLEGGRGTR